MALEFTPLHPHFGAEVRGIDLRYPVSEAIFGQLVDAFNEYSLLVFREQPLTDEEQVAFSRRFGPLEPQIGSIVRNEQTPPEVFDLSNVDPEGRLIPPDDRRMLYQSGNRLWHSDSSYKCPPALASLLSAREVPPAGGETEFASMRAGYAALSDEMKRYVDHLAAVHDFAYSRGLVAPDLLSAEQRAIYRPVVQRLVRTNPANGRRSLFIGSHASHVVGMPIEEGRALLKELLEFTTRTEFVINHRWRLHDLVMWDNRCLLHRGRPWDTTRYRRVMRRTTVAGGTLIVPNDDPTVLDEVVVVT